MKIAPKITFMDVNRDPRLPFVYIGKQLGGQKTIKLDPWAARCVYRQPGEEVEVAALSMELLVRKSVEKFWLYPRANQKERLFIDSTAVSLVAGVVTGAVFLNSYGVILRKKYTPFLGLFDEEQ